MRIEAGTPLGYSIRMVWHCEECRRLMDVAWVDTDTSLYGVFLFNKNPIFGADIPVRTIQAKKIMLREHVIYINPLDEPNELETNDVEKEATV